MFQKRPVVDMDAALQQAQHRLGISNADAPHYAPNIDELRASLNNPQGIQGAYVPESHSIHIEPDRWQALRKLLGPFGNGNPLNSLPKPIQRFLGNAYKHHTSATELATHEMTHARQFIQVRKMSIEHARQVVQSAFPNQSQEAIQQLLNSLSFKGKIGNAARHRAGEQYLLQVAEHHFKQQNLLQKFLSRPAYSYNQYQHKLFKSYMRAPYEIEARQAAAQALIADAAKKLKQAQGIYQNHKILKQYRAARIEAKLNQLLRKFNKLEKAGLIPQAANTEKQLASWAQIQNARTSTYNYLQHEQILQAQAQTTQKIIQTKELVKAVQAGQTGILTTIKNFVGGILSRIVRFFTPQGVKQAEQQFHSLRPAYVAVNGYINREA
jgi:DNA polymerase III delta prime subunit